MLTRLHHILSVDLSAAHSCCKPPVSPKPKGSAGFRAVDWGGHWSAVNSPSCSWNQFETTSDLSHGALSINLWKMVHCGHKGMFMWCLRYKPFMSTLYVFLAKGVTWKHSPHYYTTTSLWLTQQRLGPWIHAAEAKNWRYHLHLSRNPHLCVFAVFSCPGLVSLCPLLPQIIWSWLTGVEPNMVFCCCSSFTSRFNMLKCFSAHHSWLSEEQQPPASLAVILWSLPSTRCFLLQNCRSLDVFCFYSSFWVKTLETVVCENPRRSGGFRNTRTSPSVINNPATVRVTEVTFFPILRLTLNMYLQHCTAATGLASWIIAWISRCTGVPNKVLGEFITWVACYEDLT